MLVAVAVAELQMEVVMVDLVFLTPLYTPRITVIFSKVRS